MDYKTNLYWAIRNANKNGDVFEGEDQPHEDEAERLTECFEALAGIPDPVAFVAAARECVEAGAACERDLAADGVTNPDKLRAALRRLKEVTGGN